MSPPIYTDTPLSLIPTPKFLTGKVIIKTLPLIFIFRLLTKYILQTDPFTLEASHMALSHNAFIRGFNSIYQQAPRIKDIDKKDFVGYCLAWHDCISHHHHYEETEFFPALDKAAAKVGLMDGAVEQHGTLIILAEASRDVYLQNSTSQLNSTEVSRSSRSI